MRPTILLATWSDGIFALTGDQLTREIAGQPVRGLAADGRGGALAVVGGHSLQRRSASGEWSTVATSDSELACCLAVRDAIYAGTDDARMLRLNPGSDILVPVDAFDCVAGRDAWFAGSAIIDGRRVGPPLGIRSLAASSTGTVLFANVHVGGIPRSTDDGRTWQPTIDIHSDVHEVSVYPADPRIVAAAAAVGLCISRDSGDTWTVEKEGLHSLHCSAVAFSGDGIFFSAAASPFAAEGRVYRRPVQPDGSIVCVEGGMPAWTQGKVDTGCIAAHRSSVAIVDWGGNLYGSNDFGRSWPHRSNGLPPPSGVLIL